MRRLPEVAEYLAPTGSFGVIGSAGWSTSPRRSP